MFSRLRKNKNRLHHSDPEVRRQAVTGLPRDKAESLSAELSALAANDPDSAVRTACISRLFSPEALGPLLNSASVATLAAQRIAELIGDTDVDPGLLRHPVLLPLVLPKLPEPEAQALLGDVSDDALLIELCLANRGALRAALLERITSAKALVMLERESRNHDKSLNRHARSGLERIRAARQAAADALSRVSELLEALEHPERGSRQRQIALQQELQTKHADLLSHQTLLRAAGETPEEVSAITQRIALLPPPPAEEKPKHPAAKPAGSEAFVELATKFEALHQAMAAGTALTQITAERDQVTEAWLRAADQRQPSKQQHTVFETVSHAYQEFANSAQRAEAYPAAELQTLPEALPLEVEALNDLWVARAPRRKALKQLKAELARIRWPDWAEPTKSYAALLQRASQLEQELAQLDAHAASIKADLTRVISKLSAEVAAGETNKAANTLTDARRLSRLLPPEERAADDLLARLNAEAAKFAELRDWQTFATSPKRQALCEQMQAIAEQPLEPKAQADRIKQLRQHFNELGRVSRREDRALADEFNRLAETAFEPCRSFFAEQAKVRHENLEARRAICEQLREYLASTHWETADMKAAEQILRAARSEWRRFHPVDRNPGGKVESEFEALQSELHRNIKSAWDANLLIKQGIVRDATNLADGEAPLDEKIAGAKALQEQWKQVGTTPRKPDQQLWQAFREACDRIFTDRDAAREQADQSLQTALKQTSDLLAELRATVAVTSAGDARADFIRDARGRFAQLPQIPERAFRDAQHAFDDLMGQYRKLIDLRAATERRDQLRQLQAWDSAATEFERSRQAGAGQAYNAPAPCFAERLANPGQPPALESLRERVIVAELLAGVDSPAPDQELRLKIQVEALQANMGKNPVPPDPLALAEAWCAVGPKCWDPGDAQADAQCSALRERLFLALEKALEKAL